MKISNRLEYKTPVILTKEGSLHGRQKTIERSLVPRDDFFLADAENILRGRKKTMWRDLSPGMTFIFLSCS